MRKFPYLHVFLFLLTFLSTLAVGALNAGVDIIKDPFKIYKGLPFSATLLCILLAHEFSHFLASRKHGVQATLPYFLPAPTLFGTLGAFIKMKSPINTRNALMDIGASGPIAGFIVAMVATIIGLFLSNIVPVNKVQGMITLGDSLLFKALTRLIVGSVPDGHDVILHPVAFAGWIGFFVTALNLIPIGQLDGGHIMYALMGERHAKLSMALVGVMVGLGLLVWEGWLVWGALLIILGFRHPPIIYSEIPLDDRRKRIGWFAVAIFVFTFIPVPITIV